MHEWASPKGRQTGLFPFKGKNLGDDRRERLGGRLDRGMDRKARQARCNEHRQAKLLAVFRGPAMNLRVASRLRKDTFQTR